MYQRVFAHQEMSGDRFALFCYRWAHMPRTEPHIFSVQLGSRHARWLRSSTMRQSCLLLLNPAAALDENRLRLCHILGPPSA